MKNFGNVELAPALYMLVGLPGSGKSTWVSRNKIQHCITLSTDSYIEWFAATTGRTYNEVFKECIKRAEAFMNSNLESALETNFHIIWDQTNLTVKSRAKKLQKIPDCYRKVAVCFNMKSSEELLRVNEERSKFGRSIPHHVLSNMINTFEEPTTNEGFDSIVNVWR